MRRRVIALVAALLLAGVGTFVLVGFVRGAEERATAGQELALVYVVNQPIPEGTSGADIAPFVRRAEIPAETVSPNLVTDLAQLDGFVAEVDLQINEQLTTARWITPAEAAEDDLQLLEQNVRIDVPEGHMTLPIQLSAQQALAGTVTAGDRVAVVGYLGGAPVAGTDTVTVGENEVAIPESASEGGGEETAAATHIILEEVLVVEVLASSPPVFAEPNPASGTPRALLAPTGNFVVTFALQPNDVERMVFLAKEGEIWLALQTPDDDGPTSVTRIEDIFAD